ncbi:hypothetical protein ASPZODRAFT_1544245 [Penicilliopsis zonata CBS 506.65]|uniref:Methyltransferase type 11 domain-containing protein n=1 Tax=Penicilliopsis zonata CBS 506.65 TaxID=1073090 RepID=A0A1L9SLZ6_9EURO|nr:hypothetical protein ASPZODRAFT_1544245 [Penicilliopsis zonata CBS 506.65]OJJ48245.1 hypothetical protein ASPZODRAFT_1544245 [Penicilliopsis zonata CBS 506.65]
MGHNNPTIAEWIRIVIMPGMMLSLAMASYVRVCFRFIREGQILAPFLQASKIRDEAFGKFWVQLSAMQPKINMEEESKDPSEMNSSDLIPPLLARASGVVLDIGPGTGTQMPLLSKQHAPGIRTIYGPEPCRHLHAALHEAVAEHGLTEVYTVLPCGVAANELLPALAGQGIVPAERTLDEIARQGGLFDTIVCVRVLCSVPDLEATLSDLYALLRPGGQILVTEHTVNPWRGGKGSLVARAMQVVYTFLGWSYFMGDCALNRDTERALRGVADRDGGWDLVELDAWFGNSTLPYIAGRLVKRL